MRARSSLHLANPRHRSRDMLRRIFLAVSLVLSLVFAPNAPAQQPTLSGLKLLTLEPPNAVGTYDGVATFAGAMPPPSHLAPLRGLGLTVQAFRTVALTRPPGR